MRTGFTNAPGVTYDAGKTDVVFAEDLNEITDSTTNLRFNQYGKNVTSITGGNQATVFNLNLPILANGEAWKGNFMFYDGGPVANWRASFLIGASQIVDFQDSLSIRIMVEVYISPASDSGMREGWCRVSDPAGTCSKFIDFQINEDFSTALALTIDVKNNSAGTTVDFGTMWGNGEVWNNGL